MPVRSFWVTIVAVGLVGGAARAADPTQVPDSEATIRGTYLDLEGRTLDFPIAVEDASASDLVTAQVTMPLGHGLRGELSSPTASMTNFSSLELGDLAGTLDCPMRKGQLRGRTVRDSKQQLRVAILLDCTGTLTSKSLGDLDVELTLKIRSDLDVRESEHRERVALSGRVSGGGESGRVKLSSDTVGDDLPGILAAVSFGPNGAPLSLLLPTPAAGAKPGEFTGPNAQVRIEDNFYDADSEGRYRASQDRSSLRLVTEEPGGSFRLKDYQLDGSGDVVAGAVSFSFKGYRGKTDVLASP